MQSAAVVRTFDGKPLEFQTWKGRPCVAARSLGAVLGYTDGARLVDQVRGPWRSEFLDGHDVDLLSGDDLAAWNRYSATARKVVKRQVGFPLKSADPREKGRALAARAG